MKFHTLTVHTYTHTENPDLTRRQLNTTTHLKNIFLFSSLFRDPLLFFYLLVIHNLQVLPSAIFSLRSYLFDTTLPLSLEFL